VNFMLRSSENHQPNRTWFWLFRSHNIPFIQNRPLHIIVAVFVFIWVLTAIHPVDWKDWLIENILLALLIGALALLVAPET
jgi:putative membrane protein